MTGLFPRQPVGLGPTVGVPQSLGPTVPTPRLLLLTVSAPPRRRGSASVKRRRRVSACRPPPEKRALTPWLHCHQLLPAVVRAARRQIARLIDQEVTFVLTYRRPRATTGQQIGGVMLWRDKAVNSILSSGQMIYDFTQFNSTFYLCWWLNASRPNNLGYLLLYIYCFAFCFSFRCYI